ncbi:hypothetical protein SLA2020_372170 [Shorea laevis]
MVQTDPNGGGTGTHQGVEFSGQQVRVGGLLLFGEQSVFPETCESYWLQAHMTRLWRVRRGLQVHPLGDNIFILVFMDEGE